MRARYIKSDFELFFSIVNTESCDLFQNDTAYMDIHHKVTKAKGFLENIQENEVYVVDYYKNQFPALKQLPVRELREELLRIQSKQHAKRDFKLSGFFSWLYTRKKLNQTKNSVNYLLAGRDSSEIELITALLLEQCTVLLQLEQLELLWGVTSMSFESSVSKYKFLQDITYHAEEALQSYEQGIQGIHYWSEQLGLRNFRNIE